MLKNHWKKFYEQRLYFGPAGEVWVLTSKGVPQTGHYSVVRRHPVFSCGTTPVDSSAATGDSVPSETARTYIYFKTWSLSTKTCTKYSHVYCSLVYIKERDWKIYRSLSLLCMLAEVKTAFLIFLGKCESGMARNTCRTRQLKVLVEPEELDVLVSHRLRRVVTE